MNQIPVVLNSMVISDIKMIIVLFAKSIISKRSQHYRFECCMASHAIGLCRSTTGVVQRNDC
jgi:hypothetical protein